MIELKITADTPDRLRAHLVHLAQDATLADQVRQSFAQRQAAQQAPVTETVQGLPPDLGNEAAEATSDAQAVEIVETVEPPKKPRGRKPAAPVVEAKAEPDPLDTPEFLKPEAEAPKTMDGMRVVLNQVVEKKGVKAVEEIINGKMGCAKFSAVPAERYGELARLCEEALAS